MLLPPGPITCCPLCSTGFHRFPRYYEAVRLLTGLRGLSIFKTSIPPYHLVEPVRSPRYTGTTFVRSPRSIDPDGISPTLRLRVVLAACDLEDGIGFRSLYLTRLYRFTVSHCGSRTPLPTLKPHLAASAPRLSTGCSLRFAGSGLSPDCITCTELAHPQTDIIVGFIIL